MCKKKERFKLQYLYICIHFVFINNLILILSFLHLFLCKLWFVYKIIIINVNFSFTLQNIF